MPHSWNAISGTRSSISFPQGTGAFAETMCPFMAWGFVVDDDAEKSADSAAGRDRFVHLRARLVRILEIPQCLRPDDPPHARAWADIASAIHSLATHARLRRALDGWRAHLLGCLQELTVRRTGTAMSVHDYFPLRLASGAALVICAMIEIAGGRDIPGAEIESPLGKALTETAFMTILIDNETLSRRKEAEQGTNDLSLLRALQDNGHSTPHEAPHAAARMRDGIFARFLQLRDRVHAEHGPAMRAYADNLALFDAGVVAFMPTDQRHAAAEAPSLSELSSVAAPPHLDTTALPIASIAWVVGRPQLLRDVRRLRPPRPAALTRRARAMGPAAGLGDCSPAVSSLRCLEEGFLGALEAVGLDAGLDECSGK
ncbi:terpene synthase family protein [Streptomyces celluloflavus]|uniref:terpene synthase family protein n=1 Tax=Streptomyces celluloflavus TaxID=58344 RepID=UPI00365A7967